MFLASRNNVTRAAFRSAIQCNDFACDVGAARQVNGIFFCAELHSMKRQKSASWRKTPLTGEIRYPERALRFHSSGPPRRVISTHLPQGKKTFHPDREYPFVTPGNATCFLSNSKCFWRLIVRKSRRDGRRSPGLSLGSARRHHHHHHVTYVAGNRLHLARGVSCTLSHTRAPCSSARADWLTGRLRSRDRLERSTRRTGTAPLASQPKRTLIGHSLNADASTVLLSIYLCGRVR